MIKLNDKTISSVYSGTKIIEKIYKGTLLVYEGWKNLITSGVPPLTLTNCKGVDLVGYKIYGNSIPEEKILPDEYQEIAYLENHRTTNEYQYIDTGVIPNNSTSIDLVYQSLNYSQSQYILGTRQNVIDYAMNGSSSRTDWDIRLNGTTTYSNVERTAEIWRSKISLLDGNGVWDLSNLDTGKSWSFKLTNKKVDTTLPLGLFCYKSTTEANTNNYTHYNLRVYSLKIYDGETLIRNFKPCYRKSDGVNGLYDLINNTFYTNAGTGKFDIGNIMPIKIESVGEYDRTTGKYIIPVKSNDIITNIYLNEPLRKLGNYADIIDFKQGKIIRKIGVQTFDGTETWVKHTTTREGYGVYRNENLLTPLINAPLNATFMTHFNLCYKAATADFILNEYRFAWSGSTNIGSSRIYVSAEQTTVEEFEKWLANNKPSIYYPIATPTEETIELPNIPTIKGTTILSVDTTIQPSNLEVVYKGK